MFGTVKVKNRQLIIVSLGCLVIFVAVCLLLLRAGAPDSIRINGEEIALRAQDDADIAAFLQRCGCDNAECISDREVTIPKLWNDTYESYQEIQRSQGFDLVPYKGKSARELIYDCGGDYAALLVCGDQIIAAHKSRMDGGDPEPLIPDA